MKLKNSKFIVGMLCISCMITFLACAVKNDNQRQEIDKNGKKITVIDNSNGLQSLNIDNKNSIDSYLSLIGINKEKVDDLLGEKPVLIDEGGLSFEKTGIRVWFKDYGNGQVVDQIFTQREDINFNNANNLTLIQYKVLDFEGFCCFYV